MPDKPDVLIVMPVYNDWDAAGPLCRHLDSEFGAISRYRIRVLLVNDGSTRPLPEDFPGDLTTIASIDLLNLTRNLGHQRAIAVALAFICENVKTDIVLVMDADGEDRAEDVPRLLRALEQAGGEKIVFAARRKRLESTVFQFGYLVYRHAHRLLTGFSVRVGNFSAIPARYLASLSVNSELWAHYAAAVVHARIPILTIPADRGKRLAGQSHMNYVGLVTHGLRAMSVFRDRVGTRSLIVASILCCGLFALLFVVFATRIWTDAAIPGWATVSAGILSVLILQLVTASFAFAFGILASRDDLGFLPIRDYKYFTGGLERVHDEQRVRVCREGT